MPETFIPDQGTVKTFPQGGRSMRAWYKRCGTRTARTLVLPEQISTTVCKASCAALFKLKIAVKSLFSAKFEYKSIQFCNNSGGFCFRYKWRFSLLGHHQMERNCATGEEHDESTMMYWIIRNVQLTVQNYKYRWFIIIKVDQQNIFQLWTKPFQRDKTMMIKRPMWN